MERKRSYLLDIIGLLVAQQECVLETQKKKLYVKG